MLIHLVRLDVDIRDDESLIRTVDAYSSAKGIGEITDQIDDNIVIEADRCSVRLI